MRKSRRKTEPRKPASATSSSRPAPKRPQRVTKRAMTSVKKPRRLRVSRSGKRANAKTMSWVVGWIDRFFVSREGRMAAVVAAPMIIAWVLWKAYSPMRPVSQSDMIPPPVPPVTEQKSDAKPPEGLGQQFGEMNRKALGDRISYWSQAFFKAGGTPGVVAKIKGAPAIADNVPLVPKKYDCTTFVETVSALARSRSEADFYANLIAIRYRDGQATFLGRNHFPEADWIPNNTKAGILRDVTAILATAGGVLAQTASKEIRRGEWLAQQITSGRTIASVGEPDAVWAAPTFVNLPYVTLDDVERLATRIPNGTVINLVRKGTSQSPVLISHQGFIVQDGGKTYMRHATPKGHIKNQELQEYLQMVRRSGIVGANFNSINDPT